MATLNICGFETGNGIEALLFLGTVSIDSSVKRTGAYSLLSNPASSGNGYAKLAGLAATGEQANLGRSAETFFTYYFRFSSLPGSDAQFTLVANNAGTEIVSLRCDASGNITLKGTTTSATIKTISTGTWYRVDLRVTPNATCGVKIDGGSETTVTGANVTPIDGLFLGRLIATETNTYSCYYDDVLISSSAFPGAGEVRALFPTGAGNYSGWTNGTGSTFAEVDETPHDADFTNISASSSQSNTASTFDLTTTSSAGVAGSITAIKSLCVCKTDSVSGTSNVGVRLRSSGTDNNTTAREWTTTYTSYGKIYDTDPNGGGAWTSSAVDGVECGPYANTIVQAQRCTQASVMVWSTGATPVVVTPPTASLTTTRFAPQIQLGVVPPTKALTTTRFAPQLKLGVIPPTKSLTTTRFAPSISIGVLITPPKLGLVTTTFAPNVTASDHKVITPGTCNLVLTTFAPSNKLEVHPPTASLVLTTYEPLILIPQIFEVPTANLVLATFAPTVQIDLVLRRKRLIVNIYDPTIIVNVTIIPSINNPNPDVPLTVDLED